ncbi:hypothetical protein [Bacillus sp. ISL-7]|uniref:hypothetical protein n=1 Tax=Bacillus sp. ISL-7 TaxID=2819136 RepID=UPI001BE8825F|nr:hypothetical protein [Bacillus sp. ISL-7]MBT2736514.1 hypothetical protein [Bacillus sp. ISL-7]
MSTFQALVQAIIPATTYFSKPFQTAGALELRVYEYVIWILDHSIALPVKKQLNLVNNPMSKATAELLDSGAAQFIRTGQIQYPFNVYAFPGGGPFTTLSPIDRLNHFPNRAAGN